MSTELATRTALEFSRADSGSILITSEQLDNVSAVELEAVNLAVAAALEADRSLQINVEPQFGGGLLFRWRHKH